MCAIDPMLGSWGQGVLGPQSHSTWRNASGAANTALVATGAVALAPAAAWAAPYAPAIGGELYQFGEALYYNPATWVAAQDVIRVLTPPVSLPQTWPGFAVCVSVQCWNANPN